eukprot:scaffold189314_cov16-Tisochrysis_lutea.AAC.1
MNNTTSSGAFVDDLICLVKFFHNLQLQAKKLSPYADWAHLIISGNKTKVTCILHSKESAQLRGNTSIPDSAQHLQENPGARPTCSIHALKRALLLLGCLITVDLNWYQIQSTTQQLSDKLERLERSHSSPKQTLDVLRIVVIPLMPVLFQASCKLIRTNGAL